MGEREKSLTDLGRSVVERARARGASVAEAVVREGAHLSVKVRKGEPELVEEAGSRSLGLRVMDGQRVAVTHTNDLSKAGIDRLIDDAMDVVKLSEPDSFAGAPDPGLLSKQGDHANLDLFDPAMGSIEAADAIDRAKRAERAAFDHDPRIVNSEGGTFTRIAGGGVLVTSGGFVGFSEGTYASIAVRPVVEDEGGKKRTGSHWSARRHLAELDAPEAVGKEAAIRTTRKLGARKVDTQEAPVIFDPDAARSIVGTFAGCLLGGSIWRKSSYLVGREDSVVASSLVRMVDDPFLPRRVPARDPSTAKACSRGAPCGGEAACSRRTSWTRYAARKLGKESTASASRGSSGGVSASTTNFVFEARHDDPGGAHQESTKRGPLRDGHDGLWLQRRDRRLQPRCIGLLDRERRARVPSFRDDHLAEPRRDAEAHRRCGVADLDLRTSTASPTFRVSAK
jgi:PmbA protein